jgi:hypothetical protein
VAEITPNTLDEYFCISTTIHTGSKNRLKYKHMSPHQDVLQWLNTQKRKFKRDREDAISNNI